MRIRVTGTKRIVASDAVEPLSLADAKIHCRVDFADDDAYLTQLIKACRRAVESRCKICIIPTTVTAVFSFKGEGYSYPSSVNQLGSYSPGWEMPPVELPYGPIPGDITSVTYLDDSNVVTTLDPTVFSYYVRGGDYKTLQIVNPVFDNATVIYTAGYGDYTTLPEDLLLAIKQEVSFRYENRGDSTNRYAAQNEGLSQGANYLLNDYIRYAWL